MENSEKPKLTIFRYAKWMRILAFFELLLSVIAFCVGSACTSINLRGDHLTCIYGTAIWVAILCTGRAVFGLVYLNPIFSGKRRPLSAFFLLCLLSTIAACVLTGISAMWIQRASNAYQLDGFGGHLASYVLNVILLIIALAYIICCAISTTMMVCYYFGCHFTVHFDPPYQVHEKRRAESAEARRVLRQSIASENARNFDESVKPQVEHEEISPENSQQNLQYENEIVPAGPKEPVFSINKM